MAEFWGQLGHQWDLFTAEGRQHVIPRLRDEWPGELKQAVDRRRRATLTGRCDCGATVDYNDARGRAAITMEHEDGCIATDQHISQLLERHDVMFQLPFEGEAHALLDTQSLHQMIPNQTARERFLAILWRCYEQTMEHGPIEQCPHLEAVPQACYFVCAFHPGRMTCNLCQRRHVLREHDEVFEQTCDGCEQHSDTFRPLVLQIGANGPIPIVLVGVGLCPTCLPEEP